MSENEDGHITKEQAHRIASEAATTAVKQVFREMGIDAGDFKAIEAFRDDLKWVSKYRKHSEDVGSKIIITLTTIATGGVIAAIWHYLRG
jgi:hypothetical protein